MNNTQDRITRIFNNAAQTVYAGLLDRYKTHVGGVELDREPLLVRFGRMTDDELFPISEGIWDSETVELMKARKVYPKFDTPLECVRIAQIATDVFLMGNERFIMEQMLKVMENEGVTLTIYDIYDGAARKLEQAIADNRPTEITPGIEGRLTYFEPGRVIYQWYKQHKDTSIKYDEYSA